MTIIVNIREAKTHLSRLLVQVAEGDEIVIAKAGKPIARLVPVLAWTPRRLPASAVGLVQIVADVDEPLPDDLLDAIRGAGLAAPLNPHARFRSDDDL